VAFSQDGAGLVNKWHHLAVTVDRTAGFIRSYRDGIQTEKEAIVIDSVTGMSPLCLGERTQPMQGWLDEARVHATARSADWFTASYANVALRSQFMMIGDER
jgi:hypothetical protein